MSRIFVTLFWLLLAQAQENYGSSLSRNLHGPVMFNFTFSKIETISSKSGRLVCGDTQESRDGNHGLKE